MASRSIPLHLVSLVDVTIFFSMFSAGIALSRLLHTSVIGLAEIIVWAIFFYGFAIWSGYVAVQIRTYAHEQVFTQKHTRVHHQATRNISTFSILVFMHIVLEALLITMTLFTSIHLDVTLICHVLLGVMLEPVMYFTYAIDFPFISQ